MRLTSCDAARPCLQLGLPEGARESCPRKAKGPEAEEEASSSSRTAHPEACCLLTSLQYQVNSKKGSAAHKHKAEEILHLHQTNKKQKWHIMQKLLDQGVFCCS